MPQDTQAFHDAAQENASLHEPLLELQGFIVGPLQTNCYLYEAQDNGKRVGIIIDPGDQGVEIAQQIPADMEIRYIVATHGHNDHTGGVARLREACGGQYGICQPDEERARHAAGPDDFGYVFEANAPAADFYLTDGMELDLGSASFRVMHVPGHTPGSCIFVGQKKAAGLVFTGDVLFQGSIGRCDLPGGDERTMRASLKRIITELDPQSHIFPGHGNLSRLYKELASNPFLQDLQ